jgi:FkbM family methyltransferase
LSKNFWGVARLFDYRLKKSSYIKALKNSAAKINAYLLLHEINPDHLSDYVDNIKLSKAQIAQDLFVLSELGFKKSGFFVEFGATDGVQLSNTHLLETEFSWTGILAEPGRNWHKELEKNRNASIEKDCVWSVSNEQLTFNEVASGELSTINSFSGSDGFKKTRQKGKKYEVKTISLNDLLVKYNAPKLIDYLSIDTEGSEHEILSAFDFSEHKFRVITCEHNFTENREKIHSLLERNGYVRKHAELSKFDDWYVLADNE